MRRGRYTRKQPFSGPGEISRATPDWTVHRVLPPAPSYVGNKKIILCGFFHTISELEGSLKITKFDPFPLQEENLRPKRWVTSLTFYKFMAESDSKDRFCNSWRNTLSTNFHPKVTEWGSWSTRCVLWFTSMFTVSSSWNYIFKGRKN